MVFVYFFVSLFFPSAFRVRLILLLLPFHHLYREKHRLKSFVQPLNLLSNGFEPFVQLPVQVSQISFLHVIDGLLRPANLTNFHLLLGQSRIDSNQEQIFLSNSQTLQLVVKLLDLLQISLFAEELHFLNQLLDLRLDHLNLLLELGRNFPLVERNVLLRVYFLDLVINYHYLLSEVLEGVFNVHFLQLESLQREVVMELLDEQVVVSLVASSGFVPRVREESQRTHCNKEVLTDLWIVVFLQGPMELQRTVPVLAHDHVQFVSENVYHYN